MHAYDMSETEEVAVLNFVGYVEVPGLSTVLTLVVITIVISMQNLTLKTLTIKQMTRRQSWNIICSIIIDTNHTRMR